MADITGHDAANSAVTRAHYLNRSFTDQRHYYDIVREAGRNSALNRD